MANGTLKVQNIETSSGSGTITLGQSGETIALGATTNNLLTPAFEAYRSGSDFDIGDNTRTLVEFDAKTYDTDSAYSNTDYRFTVPSGKSGKYFFYAFGFIARNTLSNSTVNYSEIIIRKNGTDNSARSLVDFRGNAGRGASPYVSCVLELSVGDYVDVTARCSVTSATGLFEAGTNGGKFGGYRIG